MQISVRGLDNSHPPLGLEHHFQQCGGPSMGMRKLEVGKGGYFGWFRIGPIKQVANTQGQEVKIDMTQGENILIV